MWCWVHKLLFECVHIPKPAFFISYPRMPFDNTQTTNLHRENFDTALIEIFILTVEQMVICNVKGVAHSDKPTENYHQVSMLDIKFELLLAHCFGLLKSTVLLWLSLTSLINYSCQRQQQTAIIINSDKFP